MTQGTSAEGSSPPCVEVKNLVKTFGGVVALDHASLTAESGRVTALVGDNGAGKSTLIKCIAGVHTPDAGTVLLDGTEQHFDGPFEARAVGIEVVYQELALADNLDVAANMFLGREERHSWRHAFALKRRSMRQRASEILDGFGVHLPSLTSPVRDLSGGQRQSIAIARAVGWGTRVVVMDEPTAALGVRETRNVQGVIRRLVENDLAVILVSHSLDQVFEVSDKICVLNRGRLVKTLETSDANPDEVVGLITGASSVGGRET